MDTLVANLAGNVRRRALGGRAHLVVDAVILREGVLNGSQGALFYSKEQIGRNIDDWNHIPVTISHPTINGEPVSARHPEAMNKYAVGVVMNSKLLPDHALACELWLDEERLRRVDNRVYLILMNKNRDLEVSTGLFTIRTKVPLGTSWNGKSYEFNTSNYKPDHLALLPDEVGACSNKDGCGIKLNSEGKCDKCGGVVNADNPRSQVTGMFKPHGSGTGAGLVHEMAQLGSSMPTAEDAAQGALAKAECDAGYEIPTWAADPNKWIKAREEANKAHDELRSSDTYTKAAYIYRKLGGTIGAPPELEYSESSMPASGELEEGAMERAKVVNWLVANCECSKKLGAETLNKFSDEQLTAYHENAVKSQTNTLLANAARKGVIVDDRKIVFNAKDGKVTVNAYPPQAAAAKEDAADGGADDAEEDAQGNVVVPPKKKGPPMPPAAPTANKVKTVEEYLNDAPDEVKQMFRFSANVLHKERAKLIEKITANMSPENKTAQTKLLVNKKLEDLEEEANRIALLTPVSNKRNGDETNLLSLFNGAQGAGGPLTNSEEVDDVLPPTPTLNWSELSAFGKKKS